jgi:hypothetical protein
MFKVPLLRTDLNGTITITSDGKDWKVEMEKEEEQDTKERRSLTAAAVRAGGWIGFVGQKTLP